MPRRFFPLGDPFVRDGRITPRWEGLLRDLIAVPSWVRGAERSSLQAALSPVTLVPSEPRSETLYRLSYYVRVVQAATVSSSLQVTITWTDGGVTQTYTGALLTGNTTTTLEQQTELLIQVDPDTPVEVSTSYASVGADPMEYDVEVAHEPVVRQRQTDV